MSGSFPLLPAPESLALTQQSQSYQSEAHSLRTITRSRGANRWMITASYNDFLTEDELWPLYCFSLKQQGKKETFSIIIPNKVTPRGTGNGTPVIKTTVSAGLLAATASGFSANETVLEIGDIFKIAGNTKVYMTTSAVVSNGSGTANIDLYPPLLAIASAGSALTIASVAFTVRFTNDNVITQIVAPLQHDFDISMVEDILD